MNFVFSPDIILCGWLDLKYQLTNKKCSDHAHVPQNWICFKNSVVYLALKLFKLYIVYFPYLTKYLCPQNWRSIKDFPNFCMPLEKYHINEIIAKHFRTFWSILDKTIGFVSKQWSSVFNINVVSAQIIFSRADIWRKFQKWCFSMKHFGNSLSYFK